MMSALSVDSLSLPLVEWISSEMLPLMDDATLLALAPWIERQCRMLEQSKASLPLVAALSHAIDAAVSIHQRPLSLTQLAGHLDELVQLQEQCGVTLRLAELEQLSKAEVGLRLLDNVPSAELLSSEVESRIRPYLSKYSDCLADEVLSEYVQEMIELHDESNGFLDRAVAACRSISDPSARASAALTIVQLLPCADSVRSVAQLGELEQLLTDCLEPLAGSDAVRLRKLLEQQVKLLKLRRLLLRYGVRRFEVADTQQASALVLHIVAQVDTGSFDPLEDAMQVAAVYSHIDRAALRVEWIQNQLQHHGCEQMQKALAAMDPTHAQAAATHVISGLLEDMGQDNGEPLEAQQAALAKAIQLASWMPLETLHKLNAIAMLQDRCALCVSMRELATPRLREEVLRQAYLATAAAEGQPLTLAEVLSLADSLQLPRAVGLRVAALEAVQVGSPYSALEACELLAQRFTMALQPSNELAKGEEMARVICQASSLLLAQFHKQSSSWLLDDSKPPGSPSPEQRRHVRDVVAMPVRLHKLLQDAAAVCSTESLPECIRLLTDTELALEVLARCDLSAYSADTVEEEDMQSEVPRTYLDQYHEDACMLPLEKTMHQLALAREEMLSVESQQLARRAKEGARADDHDAAMGDEPSEMQRRQPQLKLDATVKLVDYLAKLGANHAALRFGSSVVCQSGIMFESGDMLVDSLHAVTNNLVNKTARARQHDTTLAMGYLLLQEYTSNTPDLAQLQKLAAGCCGGSSPDWRRAACLLESCVSAAQRLAGSEDAKSSDPEWREEAETQQSLWLRALMLGKLHSLQIDTSAYSQALNRDADGKPVSVSRSAVESTLMAMLHHQECRTEQCVRFGEQFDMQAAECKLLVAEAAVLSCRPDWQELTLSVVDELPPADLAKMIQSRQVLNKANAYDYERLVFLIRLFKHCATDKGIRDMCKRSVVMLEEVLMLYNRTVAPSEEEKQEFGESDLAETRLPFHSMLKSGADVVKRELTVESFDRLLPVAMCVQMSADQLRGCLVEKMMEEDQAGPVSNPPERLSQYTTVLLGIKDVKRAVKLSQKLAMASLNSNQNGLHTAASRIAAFHVPLQMVERWLDDLNEEAEVAEAKSAQKDLCDWMVRVKLSAVLEQHGLADIAAQWLHKTDGDITSAEVLNELFEARAETGQLIDEVAVVLEMSAYEARSQLLQQFIRSAEPEICRRCGELVQHSDMESQVQLAEDLVQLSYSTDMSVNAATRCHALAAVLGSCGEDLSVPKAQLQERYTICSQMMVLEALGVSITADELESCSKVGMIKSLWKELNHKMDSDEGPEVAIKLAELALELQVSDSGVWGDLLAVLPPSPRLLGLIARLVRIRRQACVSGRIKNLLSSWQKSVLAPLEQLLFDQPSELAAEQHDGVTLALQQLGSSPLASVAPVALDAERLVGALMNTGEPGLAVQCALCVADSSHGREMAMRALLAEASATMLPELLAQLPACSAPNGQLVGLQHLTLLVYQHVQTSRWHLQLEHGSSRHQQAFVGFLASREAECPGQLLAPLQLLMMADRVSEAVALFGVARGFGTAPVNDADKMAQIEDYMAQHENAVKERPAQLDSNGPVGVHNTLGGAVA